MPKSTKSKPIKAQRPSREIRIREAGGCQVGQVVLVKLEGEQEFVGMVSRINEDGSMSIKVGSRFYHGVRQGDGVNECQPNKADAS